MIGQDLDVRSNLSDMYRIANDRQRNLSDAKQIVPGACRKVGEDGGLLTCLGEARQDFNEKWVYLRSQLTGCRAPRGQRCAWCGALRKQGRDGANHGQCLLILRRHFHNWLQPASIVASI